MDAFITRRGGGGNPLNFTVVGGTAQPESPKENTIWVNTSIEITGWSFSLTEPIAPIPGMVWFKLGYSSPMSFNALKKNEINLYPSAVMQYVNGAFTDAIAEIYINGEWVDWFEWLYKDGVFFKSFDSNGSVTYDASTIEFTITSSGKPASIISNDTYDFSKYKSLNIIVDSVSTSGGFPLSACKSKTHNSYSNAVSKAYAYTMVKTAGKHSVPLGSGMGTGYIYFGAAEAAVQSMVVSRIWLE